MSKYGKIEFWRKLFSKTKMLNHHKHTRNNVLDKQLFIECENPYYGTCEHCKETFVRLTRFVYQDGNAFAYYYAEIEPTTHQDYCIKCLIVICEFDENNEIIHKVGFPVALWDNQEVVATMLLNANEISWQDIADIEILNRENALIHHYKTDVFRISDEILQQDKEIMDFFCIK